MLSSVAFVSLGPNCVPAELLRTGSLRTCTFGFDWLRSGFHHIYDFINMPLEDFIKIHVERPNIPLFQISNPNDNLTRTAEVEMIKPLCGYPYLYSPHRAYSDQTTHEYLRRCFKRLKHVLYNNKIYKVFILADYTNKEYANHLDSYDEIIEALSTLMIPVVGIESFCISLIRIRLVTNQVGLSEFKVINLGSPGKIILEMPDILDAENLRHHTYKSIARSILKPLGQGLSLWQPI